jgi:hypothetical protein
MAKAIPLQGRVSQIYAPEGESSRVQVEGDGIFCEAIIPEQEGRRIKQGQMMRVTLERLNAPTE